MLISFSIENHRSSYPPWKSHPWANGHDELHLHQYSQISNRRARAVLVRVWVEASSYITIYRVVRDHLFQPPYRSTLELLGCSRCRCRPTPHFLCCIKDRCRCTLFFVDTAEANFWARWGCRLRWWDFHPHSRPWARVSYHSRCVIWHREMVVPDSRFSFEV